MSTYSPNMWIMKITPGGSGNTKMYFENLFINENCKKLIGYTKDGGKVEEFYNRWKRIKNEDLIVVIEGSNRVFGVVEIVSDPFDDENDEGESQADWFYHRRKAELVKYFNPSFETIASTNRDTIIEYSGDGAIGICNEVWDKIKDEYINYKKTKQMQKKIDILKYKKQIILQGPPGTGKTHLAKKMARALIMPEAISEVDIRSIVKPGMKISSSTDYATYTVESLTTTAVNLKLESGSVQSPTFKKIAEAFKERKWDGGTRGGDAYEAAVAKYIYNHIFPEDQYKIVQFHPSYTYEDFVRGIVAESNGDKIQYRSVNKVLGSFAKTAAENLQMSMVDNKDIQIEKWVADKFEEFTAEIETQIEQDELILSGDIGVFEVESACFRYGKNWKSPSRINFLDIKKLIIAAVKGELDLDQNRIDKELSIHAHYRSTYYLSLLRIFLAKYKFQAATDKPALKQFVLVVDEINRANLPSVLGELIYALEYRDEKVETMYAIDGDSKLTIPSNLYLIGTMNTADRSVGHIDYAIKRRFAFVEVLPSEDVINEVITDVELNKKAKELFAAVAALFNEEHTPNNPTYLQSDFKAKDVQLGHSYFLAKTVSELKMKLEFEIKPLLFEYIKDGVLSQDAENKIKALTVNE